jgi:hypothetical protein
MAASGNGADLKRAQIVTLLYIIFVCFSVLNIKISILDSNSYSIKSFEILDKENRKKIDLSNTIIENNLKQIDSTEKGHYFLLIRTRLNESYNKLNSILDLINSEFHKKGGSLETEFNRRNLIEKILKSKDGLPVIKKDLFDLSKYINESPYKIPSYLEDFVPIADSIVNFKGKKQLWDSYLFLHKPTAMSYMQLVRIKLLITHTQLLYQEAALKEIGYLPTFFSKKNPELYEVKNNVKIISEEAKKPVENTNSVEVKNIKTSDKKSDIVIDDIFNKILKTIHTENIFAGLNTVLFSEFDFEMGKDVDIEISPKVNVANSNNSFIANFNRVGEYNLKFYDLRSGTRKLLFEKKLTANKLPDPILRVKGENLGNFNISMRDLGNSERLEASLYINNLNYFPGRINSYRVLRVHAGIDAESVINYGEIFQSNTQRLIAGLEKNDYIIFDNINVSLVDGTSRKPPPIMYKITN